MGVARRTCTHAQFLPEKHPRCHNVSAERRLSVAEDGDSCPRGAPSRGRGVGSKTTWTRRRRVRFGGRDLLENEACPPDSNSSCARGTSGDGVHSPLPITLPLRTAVLPCRQRKRASKHTTRTRVARRNSIEGLFAVPYTVYRRLLYGCIPGCNPYRIGEVQRVARYGTVPYYGCTAVGSYGTGPIPMACRDEIERFWSC
jgi:hypothetical protein